MVWFDHIYIHVYDKQQFPYHKLSIMIIIFQCYQCYCVILGWQSPVVYLLCIVSVETAEMGSIRSPGILSRAAGADPFRPGPQRIRDPESP